MTPSEISAEIKLPRMVCRQIFEEMNRLMLVEAQGLEADTIKSDIRCRLIDLGAKRALEALMVSQYMGPTPVTISAFENQVRRQTIASEDINAAALDKALDHMVIPEIMKSQLGPAVNSGRSMLLFGAPGNGKTALAEALSDCFRDILSIPYALFVGGQIIRFFDETLHEPVKPPPDAPKMDTRWVPCRRPVFVAGGELTMAMLELSFEPQSRFYEAPMHLKALGGIFLLDDFGLQTEMPQAFLNRWIVPLEKGFDILSLHTGKKFNLPFDQLVAFRRTFYQRNAVTKLRCVGYISKSLCPIQVGLITYRSLKTLVLRRKSHGAKTSSKTFTRAAMSKMGLTPPAHIPVF